MNYEIIARARRGILSDAEADRKARQVNQHPDYRVLRRVPDPHTAGVTEVPPGGMRLAILDCETTGLNPVADTIIELAIMIVIVDASGNVVGHEEPVSWLEQPLFELDPEITRITGITDEMLEGQRIDRNAAIAMLSSAELIMAHSAVFDLAFAEKLLPQIKESAWACSCREIDWADRGYEGRALGWLLIQSGLFTDTQRAATDVWALFTLLIQPDMDGGTVLQDLIATSKRSTFRIEATGSHFDDRKWLKRWGYSWDSVNNVWHKTISVDELDTEREQLALIRVTHPSLIEQTARERHRS
jgi:DNA polymerase-3 subunit epsilon